MEADPDFDHTYCRPPEEEDFFLFRCRCVICDARLHHTHTQRSGGWRGSCLGIWEEDLESSKPLRLILNYLFATSKGKRWSKGKDAAQGMEQDQGLSLPLKDEEGRSVVCPSCLPALRAAFSGLRALDERMRMEGLVAKATAALAEEAQPRPRQLLLNVVKNKNPAVKMVRSVGVNTSGPVWRRRKGVDVAVGSDSAIGSGVGKDVGVNTVSRMREKSVGIDYISPSPSVLPPPRSSDSDSVVKEVSAAAKDGEPRTAKKTKKSESKSESPSIPASSEVGDAGIAVAEPTDKTGSTESPSISQSEVTEGSAEVEVEVNHRSTRKEKVRKRQRLRTCIGVQTEAEPEKPALLTWKQILYLGKDGNHSELLLCLSQSLKKEMRKLTQNAQHGTSALSLGECKEDGYLPDEEKLKEELDRDFPFIKTTILAMANKEDWNRKCTTALCVLVRTACPSVNGLQATVALTFHRLGVHVKSYAFFSALGLCNSYKTKSLALKGTWKPGYMWRVKNSGKPQAQAEEDNENEIEDIPETAEPEPEKEVMDACANLPRRALWPVKKKKLSTLAEELRSFGGSAAAAPVDEFLLECELKKQESSLFGSKPKPSNTGGGRRSMAKGKAEEERRRRDGEVEVASKKRRRKVREEEVELVELEDEEEEECRAAVRSLNEREEGTFEFPASPVFCLSRVSTSTADK